MYSMSTRFYATSQFAQWTLWEASVSGQNALSSTVFNCKSLKILISGDRCMCVHMCVWMCAHMHFYNVLLCSKMRSWSIPFSTFKIEIKILCYNIAILNTIPILYNANNYFKYFSSKKLNYSQRYSLIHISPRYCIII